MFAEEDDDVYKLVTELCKHFLDKRAIKDERRQLYATRDNNLSCLKKLRARSYEILLNKTSHTVNRKNDYEDPICDLLKYAFVLKTTGKVYQANKLEKCISTLEEIEDLSSNSCINSTLLLLNELKSYESNPTFDLDIFNVERHLQDLPTDHMYSMEMLSLMSTRFDLLLTANTNYIEKDRYKLTFDTQLTITDRNLNAIEYTRPDEYNSHSVTPASSNFCTFPSNTQSSIKSYFSTNLWEGRTKKENYICKEGIVTEPESPWQCTDVETVSENGENQGAMCNLLEDLNDEMWDKIDTVRVVPECRTWETLGVLDPGKEPPFIGESNKAMLRLTKLKHMSNYPVISKKNDFLQPLKEMSREKFIENLKLLMVGVESECFVYHDVVGFRLVTNLIVPDISREALENVSIELIKIGNCYKFLAQLTMTQNGLNTFQSEGLIFKALCRSINEFLSFYKASILLIQLNNVGLINFINTVRPLGHMISDIAAICSFEGEKDKELEKGVGILTYIYCQASTITKSNTSLVINSILKSCCEVYFRLLEQWLFEGICEDTHDEFMIKARPKYLNVKAHRFWTRAFVINKQSVPGFLNDLTELILECGKAIKLLKICDPKNPICHLSTEFHPAIKVCLSVEMQNEQMKFFEEYYEKGKAAIGESVSFWSSIRQEKDAQRHNREMVTLIQKEKLDQLKREREETLRRNKEAKNKLLIVLKNQAEESALRKVKNKDAEMRADKLYLETALQREDELRNMEKIKREDRFKYYNELAAESEKAHLRADWRVKRMNLFDERILLLATLRAEPQDSEILESEPLIESPNNESEVKMEVEEEPEDIENPSLEPTEFSENKDIEKMEIDDENENIEIVETKIENNKNARLSVTFDTTESKKSEEIQKPKRPDVLDLSARQILNITESGVADLKETDNMSAAKRNKLRMLREEFGISPNNNESLDLADGNVNLIENKYRLEQIKDSKDNRLRNMSHKMDNNWDTALSPRKIYGNSIVQKNRAKNMSHWTSADDKESTGNRVTMSTEAQRNRDKILTRTVETWYDTTETFDNAVQLTEPKPAEVENENSPQAALRETPMSCTTDHFTHSINSSSVPFQSCEDTSNSEIDSDTNFDEVLKSRESTDEDAKLRFPRFVRHNYGFFQSPTGNLLHSNESGTLTVNDIRMLNSTFLEDYLKKSVMIPLQAQSRLVNTAIIKYFLQEHHLLTHLHSLRSYFFLLNGEFAKSLMHSLYKQLYQVTTPIKLLNSTFLKTTLEKAISCSISNNYMNSELLSLSVTNVPTKLEISNPEVLDCVSLNYKISWPINIIFDDAVMEQYSKVFKFLLMVGRVLWVLQEEFHILKFERKTDYYEQVHKIQLYRFSMMQFMNALHTYLTCSVLHASWAEFEKELEHATTLDKFYAAHVAYIKKILSRCMLNQRSEVILKSLCTTFNIILKFHSRITSHAWVSGEAGRCHPNFVKLEEMYNSFCQQRAYMAHVAEKFSTSGYQPHLMHFLHALNINDSFKLNTKKNSQF